MPIASVMADPAKPLADEPGAPIAKDAIDPELIRLGRSRPKVGIITAAGLVFLCGYFLLRLTPDRHFSGQTAAPDRVTASDVLAGKIDADRFIKLEDAEPLMSHSVRTTTSKGILGLRVAPVRGSAEHLWLAMTGDGWEQPSGGAYSGRLRHLGALPFADSVRDYTCEHPRPVFATASQVRGAFATNKLTSVAGDAITVTDADKVAFDVVDASTAVVVGALTDKLPTAEAWATALAGAGITITGKPQVSTEMARFEVTGSPAALTGTLEKAELWAARVEPVNHHYETTWGALRASPPTGFSADHATIPDAQVDLVGLYVARDIPRDAYVVLVGERPEEYWYVLPVTIVLLGIGLLFAWALVRAVKRDLLIPRA
jgi:hypothetical protein